MKKEKTAVIGRVEPGSAAEEAGIEPGDALLAINGEKIRDIFDYRFYIADEYLSLEIEKPDGEIWEIEIEKDEYEDIGLEFEDPLIEEAKSCTNKCIFCFIDQLPRGMRETVYFKDDDSRLSFLSGNYVTLTNMKQTDIDRIIRYRMSPINVSVHATEPELRKMMLGNRFAGDVLQKLKRLTDSGITVNTQIVLCRGVNDGKHLDTTIADLSALYPGMGSISVVPVGITRWREGLYPLTPFDMASSEEVAGQVAGWQEKLLSRHGSRIVYLADEFYITAALKLPESSEYEDFPQIENGVGLVSLLRQEFYDALAGKAGKPVERQISIATGVSAYKYIKEMADELTKRYNGLKISVFPIRNDFFGETVTVTGLLTGGDIASQLQSVSLGAELLISRSMLRAGEEIFLDDYTVGRLERALGIKVTVVDNSGIDFISKALGYKEVE